MTDIRDFLVDRRNAIRATMDFLADEDAALTAVIDEMAAPADPTPADQAPTDPVDAMPSDPAPTDPAPTDPAPTDPVPTDPPPDPAPVPPTPIPPSTAPAGARTRGPDVSGCTLPGVTVTASEVIISSPLPFFAGWDIGSRRITLKARVAKSFDIWSQDGVSSNLPLIYCLPGGGFDEAEHWTVLGTAAAMVLKQEMGAFAGVIRKWDMRGMSQDGLKVCGGNLIESNRIADAIYRGGAPHADAITIMSADGGVTIRDNDIDWNYAGRIDQSGINNWFQFASYPAMSNIWDDILIEGNRLRHANTNSFAMQVATKNSPTWRGSIKVRNNVMDKAGGVRKILYAASSTISEWSGNVDAAGADIPLSAA